MSRTVELNRPALWRAIRAEDVSTRIYAAGYPYMSNGVMLVSSPTYPVYRYAKTFTKYKLDFSLFIFTDEKDVSKVEAFFDALVKLIKKTDITETLVNASMTNFKYLDNYYKGDK